MYKATYTLIDYLGQRVGGHLAKDLPLDDYNYPTYKQLRLKAKKSGYDRRQIANAIQYLKTHKLIKIIAGKKNEKLTALTIAGMLAFIKNHPFITKSELLGGRQTMMIVSVPETERAKRDFLRHKLIQDGFVPLSYGVYLSQYKASPLLKLMIQLLEIDKYITVGEFKVL